MDPFAHLDTYGRQPAPDPYAGVGVGGTDRETQAQVAALGAELRALAGKFERVATRLAALEDARGTTPAEPLHEFTQQQDRAPRFCKWCGCAEADPDARSACPTSAPETKP